MLRQKHLVSYVFGSVEFLGAGEDEATLVSVPPYHIAGMAAILTATYGGRRLVQLPDFEPHEWVRLARQEHITHAMVVPTMLARILEVIEADGEGLPRCATWPTAAVACRCRSSSRRCALLPDVGFVNAYGLTETSSSVAVLGPDDHREALSSDDPAVRAGSARSARRCPRSSCRSATRWASPWRRRRAGRGVGARRAGLGRVRPRQRGRRRGLVPHEGRRAASTRTATCTSRVASTT